MRLRQVRLKNFKRFDDLTIDLGTNPAKIVALVGPNGSGKSSVFDAFEQTLQNFIGSDNNIEEWYFSKTYFDAQNPIRAYSRNEAITLTASDQRASFDKKCFYVRTAYRFTPRLSIDSIRKKPDPLDDSARPGYSGSLDQRLQNNYERLHGRLIAEFYAGNKTGADVRAELIESVNRRLSRVLDVKISSLGNISDGKGQLFFEKGTSKDFPFENLSAGEKEVVDLLIDLELKRHSFDDTVYGIDEPELHLNTAIQRKLLAELVELIPDNCQIWVATHSIGFLRALQIDLADQSQTLDFSERDYFSGTQIMRPIVSTRANWKRIFSTALEDLTGLLAPQSIVYCEGRHDPAPGGLEQGLDAIVYNQVFESEFPDTLFVSSGGGAEPRKYSAVALRVLGKAFDGVTLRLLKDRDEKSDAERLAFLAESPANRMLLRREIENYLFAEEILRNYCAAENKAFDQAAFGAAVTDPIGQDLKPLAQRIAHACEFRGDTTTFKKALPAHITPDTAIYQELRACI